MNKSDILKELEKYCEKTDMIEDNDITIDDFAKAYQVSRNTAMARMTKIARDNPDKFEYIRVKAGDGFYPHVLRQKGK